ASIAAPDVTRTMTKLEASMAPLSSARRARIELAENPIRAPAVRATRRNRRRGPGAVAGTGTEMLALIGKGPHYHFSRPPDERTETGESPRGPAPDPQCPGRMA